MFFQVLESISFLSFVANRGPPYRTCDLFDQVCVNDLLRLNIHVYIHVSILNILIFLNLISLV